MMAINEKSTSMIDRVLRDFKDSIDFEEGGNSMYFAHETAYEKS